MQSQVFRLFAAALAINAANGLVVPREAAASATSSSATPWPTDSYKTEPFSSPFLQVSKTGPTAPGLIWFSPALFFPQQGPGAPPVSELSALLVNQEGDVIFHGPTFPPGEPDFYTNFRPQFFTNGTLLSYYLGAFGPVMEQSLGNVTLLDHNYNTVKTICMADYPIFVPGAKKGSCKLDLHESRRIAGDRFIVSAANYTQTDLTSVGGPKDGWVTDSQFLVINPWTEEILFKWSSLEHLDRLPVSHSRILRQNRAGQTLGTSPELAWDYFHINGVAPFEDGYVISARHFSSAVFVDSKGNVTYVLDGVSGRDFTLEPDTNFQYQHDVNAYRESNGNIRVTMFDNNNYDVPPANTTLQSSALELELDTKAMTATKSRRLFNNLTVNAIGLGTYQDQPNGHVWVSEGTFPAIAEFDENNKEVYNLRYGNTSPGTFRSYKFTNWTGTPSYPPKGVAETQKNGTIGIYMSWNGATEIATWQVQASGSTVATVRKAGFETSTSVSSQYKTFVAIAQDANGKVLGKSNPFTAK